MGQIKKLRGRKYSSLGKHIIGMCVLMLFLSSSVLHAESKLIDKTIKGTVVDDTTNQPIAGANVIVKGTKKGAVTDFDGNFTIVVPDNATTLVVSYIGYSTKDVAIVVGENLTIRLSEDASQLDEVIITALGVTKSRERVSYAAQTIELKI